MLVPKTFASNCLSLTSGLPLHESFVAVHGLHGNCNNSWRPRDEPEKNMIAEISGYDSRILNYGYNALEIGRGIYFRHGISNEAAVLLQQLAEAIKGLTQVNLQESSTGMSIIIVTRTPSAQLSSSHTI